jgi:hypothetical protein
VLRGHGQRDWDVASLHLQTVVSLPPVYKVHNLPASGTGRPQACNWRVLISIELQQ